MQTMECSVAVKVGMVVVFYMLNRVVAIYEMMFETLKKRINLRERILSRFLEKSWLFNIFK
jgi:hypothetical protein